MYKFSLPKIIISLLVCLYFNQALSQPPTFIFKNDFDKIGSSPLSKEILQKNGIIRVEEYRQNITKGKSKAKHIGCITSFYNSFGCLIKTEMKSCIDTTIGTVDNYIYDSQNRLIEINSLSNTHHGEKTTCNIKYSYFGDSIIETNCYWKGIDIRPDMDTSSEMKYFNSNKQLIKYISLGKDKSVNYIVEYEYDEQGQPSVLIYIYDDSNLSYNKIYQYTPTKQGSKLTVKRIGGSNDGGIIECIFNKQGQCIECSLDWKKLDIRAKYKYEYNDDGTILSNTRIDKSITVTKYTYYK